MRSYRYRVSIFRNKKLVHKYKVEPGDDGLQTWIFYELTPEYRAKAIAYHKVEKWE